MSGVVAQRKRSVEFLLGLGVFFIPVIFSWFLLRKGHSTIARILGFAWLAAGLLILVPAAYRAILALNIDAPAEPRKTYLSSQIAASYDENTAAADMTFKEQRVQVSGKVTDVNTDFLGYPYLEMAGTNPSFGPQFKFAKSDAQAVAAVRKELTVHVICTGQGEIAETPMFDDCKILKTYHSFQIAASYDEDIARADMRFKGKRVMVSGEVTDNNTDFLGYPYLEMVGTTPDFGPQFKFAKSDALVVAAVKKGSTVRLMCTGRGNIAETPIFEDCKIAKRFPASSN
ncbi:hypothetical protein [Pseudomonas sp.]|uniref:OB-fold protein n=1 Tax=Pseudomonas sp. TaxID=306 RepID=UPI001B057F26|nr:hypothetical protein [Pseudomonas sp.]MBO9552206.1 hypothetical protein [Pseudomonas sp.]